jgi:lipoprotein-releasing system permease protein
VYRIFLSLRYLWARRTNWVGMAGIFVAVAALIMILSIMAGFLAEGRKTLRGNLSDIIIQPVFELNRSGSRPLVQDADRMLEILHADPRVDAACVQLQWYGILGKAQRQWNFSRPLPGQMNALQLVGVDADKECATTSFCESLRAELAYAVQRVEDPEDPFALPSLYAEKPGRKYASIVVGEQLAVQWSLARGDEVKLMTLTMGSPFAPRPDGREVPDEPEVSTSSRRFVVAGTFRSKDNETDRTRIYMDRRELADFLQRREDFVRDYSTVLVKLVDYERDHQAVMRELGRELAAEGLIHDPDDGFPEVLTWEDYNRTMLAAIENEKALLGIMLSLVLVVAGFTVFAILSMMVTEKRRDIGILCALGATQRGILSLFLLLGLWDALFGATAGTLVGILLAYRIDAIEQWLSSSLGIEIFNRNVYIFDHIPSVIEPVGVGLIVLGAFFCTLLFAAIPAWRASRLNPIDALRYE